MTTRTKISLVVAAFVFVLMPSSVRAQIADEVYHMRQGMTVIIRRDTAIFVRVHPASARSDTVTYLLRGDSLWLLMRGSPRLLPDGMADMLRRTLAVDRAGARAESTLAHRRP